MVERRDSQRALPGGESILAQESVEQILWLARDTLRAQGYLTPMLLVHLANGQKIVTELELPDTTPEKEAYFTRLGAFFRRRGQPIDEAMTVVEGWYVDVREHPDALTVPVSQHPARREVISIVGRNAPGTRHTFLVQPFSRDPLNQPVFEPIPAELAQFNVRRDQGTHSEGLLDYLFAAADQGRRQRYVRKGRRRARRRR